MKIILTGGSGFLGKYISNELSQIGEVITISRFGGNIEADLSREVPKLIAVDLVVHCAGKAHSVPKTDVEKQAFFAVNLLGTANLLKGLETAPNLPRSFVFISTVAVYGVESGNLIKETQLLNAQDAYGKSKIEAEKLIKNWCITHNVTCTILRLPLLVGKNPPGNLGAMINGIKKGYYFNIDGGKAKKSMVLASDVAKIIPVVAKIGGIYNLTDGYHPSFSELSEAIAQKIGKNKPFNIPFWIAKVMGNVGDLLGAKVPINSKKLRKITANLTFDDSKAMENLNWRPTQVLKEFKIK